MSSYLAEITKQKQQQWLHYYQESRPEREYWQKQVNALYTQIKQWLKPLESEGLLRFNSPAVKESSVEEGVEERNDLIIEFFNGKTIKLESVGLEVVGAYGRVDMKLGLAKIMIVMPEKGADWIFAERYNREEPLIYDFNQENFEQFVADFVEHF